MTEVRYFFNCWCLLQEVKEPEVHPASEQSPPSLPPLSVGNSPAAGADDSPQSSSQHSSSASSSPAPNSAAPSPQPSETHTPAAPTQDQDPDQDVVLVRTSPPPTANQDTTTELASAQAVTSPQENGDKQEEEASSSSSSGSSSDSDSGDDSDSDSNGNNTTVNAENELQPQQQVTASTNPAEEPKVAAQDSADITRNVVVQVVKPVEFDNNVASESKSQTVETGSADVEKTDNKEEESSSSSSSSSEDEQEQDEQSIAVENIPSRDKDSVGLGVVRTGPLSEGGTPPPELVPQESDVQESVEAARNLQEALSQDLDSNFEPLDAPASNSSRSSNVQRNEVAGVPAEEPRTRETAPAVDAQQQSSNDDLIVLGSSNIEQPPAPPPPQRQQQQPPQQQQQQQQNVLQTGRNEQSITSDTRSNKVQNPTAAPTVSTTDARVYDSNASQQQQQQQQTQSQHHHHSQATPAVDKLQHQQTPQQKQQDITRTSNVPDNTNKHNSTVPNNNNSQCKKSLHHAPNNTLSGNPAPNFNTVETIDVTQLGLESPTSMNSSDLTNTSVDTTPSQSYSDCAQVQQQQQSNNACANTHKSSPGNYMETVNSNAYQMTSPVGGQMTSPGSSQGSFSLTNQQPGSNQSSFNVPNPVPSPSNNQSGKFNIPSMPTPSPTAAANQNYSISSRSPPSGAAPNYTNMAPGGTAPNQSPSNASNFSVPPNPSPNQGNNYTIPNPNPSPAANSTTTFNLPNPSPGNNYGNMPTPSPTNSNGSFTMAVPSPTANQQNFAVRHPTQQHHTQQQAHHQGPPPPQQQQQQPTQPPPQQQNQQQLPPPLPISAADMHQHPQSMMSTLMNYPPPMPPHMATHRLSHPGQSNSCAHSPIGAMAPRVPGNFPNQNSSCSLAKLQQLTNGIPGMEMMPESTMTPPPNLTPPPPPLNSMTPPPPSMQRDMSRNMTPPVLQGQLGMPTAVGGAGNPYKQYPPRPGGGGAGSRGVASSAAASLQKSPNVTVQPNMTFTPNVTLQPGMNVITGYNMNLTNWNGRVPQQMQYITTNPANFSLQPQPPQMNMMGMMNVHQPANFQQPMTPAAAPQPNNVYTTYGYNLSGMPQAYNLANMNGHVMRR